MSQLLRPGVPLALLLAVALAFTAMATNTVRAQTYGGGPLPGNVLALSIDGESIDGNTVPVVTDPQPTISGQLTEPGATVTIHITSDPQTFTATADANGNFSARVPDPLDNGEHTLYIDDVRVGTFIVAASQAPSPTATATPSAVPGPPATGAGMASSDQWSFAGAGVVGLAVASAVMAMWALRRRPTNN